MALIFILFFHLFIHLDHAKAAAIDESGVFFSISKEKSEIIQEIKPLYWMPFHPSYTIIANTHKLSQLDFIERASKIKGLNKKNRNQGLLMMHKLCILYKTNKYCYPLSLIKDEYELLKL